jgi:hypothetical protein
MELQVQLLVGGWLAAAAADKVVPVDLVEEGRVQLALEILVIME